MPDTLPNRLDGAHIRDALQKALHNVTITRKDPETGIEESSRPFDVLFKLVSKHQLAGPPPASANDPDNFTAMLGHYKALEAKFIDAALLHRLGNFSEDIHSMYRGLAETANALRQAFPEPEQAEVPGTKLLQAAQGDVLDALFNKMNDLNLPGPTNARELGGRGNIQGAFMSDVQIPFGLKEQLKRIAALEAEARPLREQYARLLPDLDTAIGNEYIELPTDPVINPEAIVYDANLPGEALKDGLKKMTDPTQPQQIFGMGGTLDKALEPEDSLREKLGRSELAYLPEFETDEDFIYYRRIMKSPADIRLLIDHAFPMPNTQALKALFEDGAIGARLVEKLAEITQEKRKADEQLRALGVEDPKLFIETQVRAIHKNGELSV